MPERTFGSEGAGDGQFSAPAGIAVNEASGDVYVVDRGNNRVERFSATGTYLSQFSGSGTPAGAFSSPEGIAVDNSTVLGDPSAGDVYVADTGHSVIDKFSSAGAYLGQLTETTSGAPFGELYGVAVDPSGNVWVYDSSGNVDHFADTGNFVGTFNTNHGTEPGLAIDSSENAYVVLGDRKVQKFSSITGAELGTRWSSEVGALAIDPATNDLFVDTVTGIEEFGPFGEPTSSPTDEFGGELSESHGLAMNGTTGPVYASERGLDDVKIFKQVVVPDVSLEPVTSLRNTSATLNGTVDPDNEGSASCRFEYGTTIAYGQSVPCSQGVPSGNSPVPVGANLTGLAPDTTYHYRLDASNINGTDVGQDGTFATLGPPTIDAQTIVTEVKATSATLATTSATLATKIDPHGTDTTYGFEYGPSTSYGESAPMPEADLGAGSVDVAPAPVTVEGLAAGTYHVRAVASNEFGTTYGPDRTFTTQATGGELTLPDGRVWELVSPPTKDGALIEPLQKGDVQASEDGAALAYVADAPIGAEPAGNTEQTQALATRGHEGWSSRDVAVPHEVFTGPGGGEYRLFSPDLSLALLEPHDKTPLAPSASEETDYLRNDVPSNATCKATPASCYQPLLTTANVAPGSEFAGAGFVGATPDLSHLLLSSEDALTPNAAKNEQIQSLFEWTAGQLQLVSVLPNERPANAEGLHAYLGSDNQNVRHAISSDGSKVFWSTQEAGGHLYMRDTTTEHTVQVDHAQGVAEPEPQEARFAMASEKGTMVFFVDGQQLTPESRAAGAEARDLYAYDTESNELTDLTVPVNAGEAAAVQGPTLGASEDGSYVYFVAHGVLTTEKNDQGAQATPGSPNLYMLHDDGSGWTTTFIATLSSEDEHTWSGGQNEESRLTQMSSRVSPNGHYLALMSNNSLTGYDNVDAKPEAHGAHDEEVYLYDASSHRLVCPSCNPTGARPSGVFDGGINIFEPGSSALLVDGLGFWERHWLAGSVPGWTPVGGSNAIESAFYQSRYLSDSGRLFFDSADALVPQDTNGKEDVYEYEPVGKAGPEEHNSCSESGETFSMNTEGCVALISSGNSEEESAFLDATPSGDDVFFLTTARLSKQDYDTSFDVYDAHVCTATAPCVSSPAGPASCDTAESCRAASPVPPDFLAPPATAMLSGPGNLAPAVPRPLTRAQRLSKALKACKRKPRRERKTCEVRARKRFKAKRASSGTTKSARRKARRRNG
ncbi:MAG: hypothetical protein ABSB69_02620 [Solirubrobacteraceae bacterium]